MRTPNKKFIDFTPKAQAIIKAVCESEGYEDYNNLFNGNQWVKMKVRNKCYLMARELGCSYPRIGQLFFKDHTTIMASLRKHKYKLENKDEIKKNIQEKTMYKHIPNYKTGTFEKILVKNY